MSGKMHLTVSVHLKRSVLAWCMWSLFPRTKMPYGSVCENSGPRKSKSLFTLKYFTRSSKAKVYDFWSYNLMKALLSVNGSHFEFREQFKGSQFKFYQPPQESSLSSRTPAPSNLLFCSGNNYGMWFSKKHSDIQSRRKLFSFWNFTKKQVGIVSTYAPSSSARITPIFFEVQFFQ